MSVSTKSKLFNREWILNRRFETRYANYTEEQMEDEYMEEMHDMCKEFRKMEDYY